jgi:hypothetical protein
LSASGSDDLTRSAGDHFGDVADPLPSAAAEAAGCEPGGACVDGEVDGVVDEQAIRPLAHTTSPNHLRMLGRVARKPNRRARFMDNVLPPIRQLSCRGQARGGRQEREKGRRSDDQLRTTT